MDNFGTNLVYAFIIFYAILISLQNQKVREQHKIVQRKYNTAKKIIEYCYHQVDEIVKCSNEVECKIRSCVEQKNGLYFFKKEWPE